MKLLNIKFLILNISGVLVSSCAPSLQEQRALESFNRCVQESQKEFAYPCELSYEKEYLPQDKQEQLKEINRKISIKNAKECLEEQNPKNWELECILTNKAVSELLSGNLKEQYDQRILKVEKMREQELNTIAQVILDVTCENAPTLPNGRRIPSFTSSIDADTVKKIQYRLRDQGYDWYEINGIIYRNWGKYSDRAAQLDIDNNRGCLRRLNG